jgi:hypothetical protein
MMIIDHRAVALEGLGYGPEAMASQGFLYDDAIDLSIYLAGITSTAVMGMPEVELSIEGLAHDVNLIGIESAEAFGNNLVDLTAVHVAHLPSGGIGRVISRHPVVPGLQPLVIAAKGIESIAKVAKPAVGMDIRVFCIHTGEESGEAEITIPAQILMMKRRQEQDEIAILLMAA